MMVYIVKIIVIHADMKSPEGTMTPNACPMAMDNAFWIYTIITYQDTALSPFEICS